ncbi:MAG: RluA family pseudouridine synthase [Clostridia bacterium]|nr:RluA family pseudouridine synthase [Clostridia bacterium]
MKTLDFTAVKSAKRLDAYLAENTEFSRSHIKRLIDEGKVTVCGRVEKCSAPVRAGDTIAIVVDDPKPLDLTPQDMPLDVIYQDEDIAVVNKAQGVTVHAGGGTTGNTLVNALMYHLDSLSGINGVIRPGIVHRIDKDTSGLLVVAKNDAAHLSLAAQIQKKTCKREYLALVEGVVKDDNGHIATLIGRNPKDRKLMAVTKTGRTAVTDYFVEKRFDGYTLCRFVLSTGRTHQIRVHAKYIGHPVVGDRAYGYKKQKFDLNGQLLHAFRLTLTHPRTGDIMVFEAPLPDYFEATLRKLK